MSKKTTPDPARLIPRPSDHVGPGVAKRAATAADVEAWRAQHTSVGGRPPSRVFQCGYCHEWLIRKAFSKGAAPNYCDECHEPAREAIAMLADEREAQREAERQAKLAAKPKKRDHPGTAKREARLEEKASANTKYVYMCGVCEDWKVQSDYPSAYSKNCSTCLEVALEKGLTKELPGSALATVDETKAASIAETSRRMQALRNRERETRRLKKLASQVGKGKAVRERAKTADMRQRLETERAREAMQPEAPPELNPAQKELLSRELARRSLLEFALRFMPDYQAGWMHRLICQELEEFSRKVANGESPRLMFQMPPRAGKSQLVSDFFPSWHLGRNPGHDTIIASYAESLPLEFSKNVRDRLADPAFEAVFPACKLHSSYTNATGWRTNAQGTFTPVGVGGGLTGRGAHVLIIDDPLKNMEEAESETVREAIYRWYQSTAYTRLMPGGGVIICQTRWHDDDLSGRLETRMLEGAGDEFKIIRFPSIATEDEPYRKKGEALHPERFPVKALEGIKKSVGPRVWSALYQQNPVPDEGGFVDRKDIVYYKREDLPKELNYYATWDLAIGQKQHNDFTVGLCFGVDYDDNIWLVDMVRGRWQSLEIVDRIINFWVRYKQRDVGIEQGVLSYSIMPLLKKRVAEKRAYALHTIPLKPGKADKVARARAIQGRIQQGKVFFPEDAPWAEVLLQELLRFPHGVHDDCVDALAYAGIMLQKAVKPMRKAAAPKKSWLDKLQLPSKRGGSFMSA